MALIRKCRACGRSNRIPAKHLSHVGKCGACKAELPAIGEPIEVNEEEFQEIIRESKVPVLTDFWASWCGPCRQFAPTFAASAEKHPDIVHAKVDTEAEQQLAAAAQIRSIPTLMAFKKGKLVFNQPGALPPAALEDLVQQIKNFDIDAAMAAQEGDQA